MLLIVLGTGTLGAFPVVHVRGQAVDPAAVVSTTPADAPTDFGPGVLVDTAEAPPATMVADQSTYEEREAQFTTALPDQRAQVAIRTAMAQIGLPYVWGGDGPTNGDAGFDCSGLTTFSYAAAQVSLPRTAHTQYYKGPHVPQGAALQPGDLVFYGTPAKVHHVGMYLGDGKMVNAPTFGKPVQTAFYRYRGDDYLGATRPAATGETTSGVLPYAPAAPSTGTPESFPAPVAPVPTVLPDATAPQTAEAVSAAAAAAPGVVVTTSTRVTAATTTTPVTTPVTVKPTATSTTPTLEQATTLPPSRPKWPDLPPRATVTATVTQPSFETTIPDPTTSISVLPTDSTTADATSTTEDQ